MSKNIILLWAYLSFFSQAQFMITTIPNFTYKFWMHVNVCVFFFIFAKCFSSRGIFAFYDPEQSPNMNIFGIVQIKTWNIHNYFDKRKTRFENSQKANIRCFSTKQNNRIKTQKRKHNFQFQKKMSKKYTFLTIQLIWLRKKNCKSWNSLFCL